MKHKRKTNRPLGKSKKALRKEKALRVKTAKEQRLQAKTNPELAHTLVE